MSSKVYYHAFTFEVYIEELQLSQLRCSEPLATAEPNVEL